MSHLEQDAIRRILGGLGAPQEAETMAKHIVSCDLCRALAGTVLAELRAETPEIRGEGSLQLVMDLIDRERQWGVEHLASMAAWADLRRLPNRRSQRERVRMAKACHTTSFFGLVLDELQGESSWDEAEFLAGLALLSIQGMSQRQQITLVVSHDLQAKVWTAVANARRRAAEWKKAHQALSSAERHLREGTGDPGLSASLLSITASTLADQGEIAHALEVLNTCKDIYGSRSDWVLLARTLVKEANILAGVEPSKALAVLAQAAPLIPADDPYLTLLADLLHVECLIEVRRPFEAVPVFQRCSPALAKNPNARMRIRGKFTGARLLDALGFGPQAEKLFDEVVERDVEQELYKDAFLDLLYLYGRYVRTGNPEKAARVCRRALTDTSLAAVAHDQLREVWSQLLEAAQARAVSAEVLKEVRLYLSAHWKNPAARTPVVLG